MSDEVSMIERKQHRFADTELFQPDVILPSQLLPEFRYRLMPEKRLMAAIVDDAVNCFLKYRFAADSRRRRLFREAEEWIMDGDRCWPFSFESICDTLGLDAGCLRKGLREWHARHAEAAEERWIAPSAAESSATGAASPVFRSVANRPVLPPGGPIEGAGIFSGAGVLSLL
jgi:hypothetical protein